MNIIKERGIWIVTVLIIISGMYYWTVVDSSRVEEMESLEITDNMLKGDVNEWSEYYNRIEKKWIGTSKHVRTLQDETHDHYKIYESKVDSINNVFDRIDYKVDQINETLTDRLDDLSSDLESLSEEFATFKRATQRSTRKTAKNIESILDELKSLKDKIEEEK